MANLQLSGLYTYFDHYRLLVKLSIHIRRLPDRLCDWLAVRNAHRRPIPLKQPQRRCERADLCVFQGFNFVNRYGIEKGMVVIIKST